MTEAAGTGRALSVEAASGAHPVLGSRDEQLIAWAVQVADLDERQLAPGAPLELEREGHSGSELTELAERHRLSLSSHG